MTTSDRAGAPRGKTIGRRAVLAGGVASAGALPWRALAAPALIAPVVAPGAQRFPLWPGKPPGGAGPAGQREEWWRARSPDPVGNGTVEMKNPALPELAVFAPPLGKGNGAGLVLCPGGGYRFLCIEKEGWRVARRLAERHGTACFVLKYRHFDRDVARLDANRAVRWVRANAERFGLRPGAIGLGGFSAGGHLAVSAGNRQALTADARPDAIDGVDGTPSFLLLVYPGAGEDLALDRKLPPTFLVGSQPDKPRERVLSLYERLLSTETPVEAHLFQRGHHGYALGDGIPNTERWPDLFHAWMTATLAGG